MEDYKDEMFEDGAEVIMDRLASVADAVGEKLGIALAKLAEKVNLRSGIHFPSNRKLHSTDRGQHLRALGGCTR